MIIIIGGRYDYHHYYCGSKQYIDVDYHMDNIWKEGQLLLCSRCCPIYLSIHPSNPLDLPSFLILILTIIPTME